MRRIVLIALVCPLVCLPAQTMVAQSSLQRLLREASAGNQLPRALLGYVADVESETTTLVRREDGTEFATALEQIASVVHWTRDGSTDQRIVGFREQKATVATSMLSSFQNGWLNPVLYGNRMRLRSAFGDSTMAANDTTSVVLSDVIGALKSDSTIRGKPIPVIHPLAADRDVYYAFSGGDTLLTIVDGARRIPIVRVHVKARRDAAIKTFLFEGDLDLDITRGALVRMRGYFVLSGASTFTRQAARVLTPYAFIEFENAEFDGKYWLPIKQRIELQVTAPMFTEGRVVLRLVSRFTRLNVQDSTSANVADAVLSEKNDSLVKQTTRPSRTLRWAPRSTLNTFTRWQFAMGALSADLHADDFESVAPDFMRTTGKPQLNLAAQFVSDVVRYNRVEGLFTGLSTKLSLRDRAPGTVVRATAGWAWTEQTIRGRVSVVRTRAPLTLGIHMERALDVTDDFQRNTDPPLPALMFGHNAGFVSRRSTGLFAEHWVGMQQVKVRAEVGAFDDRDAPTHVAQSPFGNTVFRENHGVDAGGYTRSAVIAEWHPSAAEPGAKSGHNARVYYQRGDGTLAFQRLELRGVNNSYVGPFRFTANANAGIVDGARIPAQRMFELGGSRALPGYDSSFTGSRAATASVKARYTTRFWTRPYEIPGVFTVPGIAPGLTAGINIGWSDTHSASARAALERLGVITDSTGVSQNVARVTNGVRGGASVGMHFFSGLLFVGFERALEPHTVWRFTMNGRN